MSSSSEKKQEKKQVRLPLLPTKKKLSEMRAYCADKHDRVYYRIPSLPAYLKHEVEKLSGDLEKGKKLLALYFSLGKVGSMPESSSKATMIIKAATIIEEDGKDDVKDVKMADDEETCQVQFLETSTGKYNRMKKTGWAIFILDSTTADKLESIFKEGKGKPGKKCVAAKKTAASKAKSKSKAKSDDKSGDESDDKPDTKTRAKDNKSDEE